MNAQTQGAILVGVDNSPNSNIAAAWAQRDRPRCGLTDQSGYRMDTTNFVRPGRRRRPQRGGERGVHRRRISSQRRTRRHRSNRRAGTGRRGAAQDRRRVGRVASRRGNPGAGAAHRIATRLSQPPAPFRHRSAARSHPPPVDSEPGAPDPDSRRCGLFSSGSTRVVMVGRVLL